MNPKQKFLARYSNFTKSILELVEVLNEIDMDNPANDAHEWSITGGDGEPITLHYLADRDEMTITKGRLKLSLNLRDMDKEVTERA